MTYSNVGTTPDFSSRSFRMIDFKTGVFTLYFEKMRSVLRPIAQLGPRPCAVLQRRLYSSGSMVELAYQLHRPQGAEDVPSKKEPIIIMHGLFGSKTNNRGISKMFAKDLKRCVFALDLRNHGESSHVPVHTYSAMAEDVENFIQENQLENPTLIGHSMGAKVAMSVALRSPSLIQDIIAVDNAPVNAQLGRKFAGYVQAMRRIEDANIKKQSEADDILKEYEDSLGVRQFLLTNLLRPTAQNSKFHWRIPVKTLANALDEMAGFPFTPGAKERFTKPSLFVRGTTSKYVSDETIPLIGEFFPSFELKDVEAGHWVISENPEGFKDVCMEFFKREKEAKID